MFLVSVGNRGCGAIWSSEIYWLCVTVLIKVYSVDGSLTPKKGMAGIVNAILFLDWSTLYLYLIDLII
jgi:hypothetical protein